VGRGLADADELARWKEAWAQAYRHTPHGRPVALGPQMTRMETE